MRLAFLGTPDFAVVSLAALVEAGFEIACVYSQPPAPRGRGKKLAPSPTHAFAEARGIAVRTPVSMRAPEEAEALRALGVDAAVVVAFGQILPGAVIDAVRLGTFNLHASLLPRWRGAAPIQRAIMAGDKATGVAVMRLTEGLDEGPVLASERLRIDAAETAGTLHDRLAATGAELMVRTLPLIAAGTAVETAQPDAGVTYAKKIRPRETKIRWDRPAAEVDRQIRGLSPFPGAWFEAASEPNSNRGPVRIKALLSRVEDGEGAPGQVLDDRLLIACGSGAVRLLAAQREGRGAQPADDFVRGFRLERILG
ncbi:MAG TPA: methionyl-tRNA formyltransferase [Caulobacteraceae bacterium]|jgi:methionyl-tRNA formyltransferase|nr:methionyl-tRNA formyltransferase [Caulobacteraceae bacterium]